MKGKGERVKVEGGGERNGKNYRHQYEEYLDKTSNADEQRFNKQWDE